MKKGLLTLSAFIFAAAVTSCGSKGSISDLKGNYDITGYASWGGDDYEDYKALKEKLENDPVKISKDGKLYFNGSEYQLVSEGKKDDMTLFSIKGSGFAIDKSSLMGIEVDSDYEGPAYFGKTSRSTTINNKEYEYDEYVIYLSAKGDKNCSAYYMFDKEGTDNAHTFTIE